MAHFYFDLHNDLDVVDREGRELSGLEAARNNAVTEAREIMTENVENGRLDLNHYIEIRDESGAVVNRTSFGEAVEVIPERR
jgi:hypothetical protein